METTAGGPFFEFNQFVQTPFTGGMASTVNAAMIAIQGPLTATVVLWIIVTGVLVMRGDVDARTGTTRIINVSIVIGILMSTTLYNQYIVSFFTNGLPNWFASSTVGTSGTAPSANSFDSIWFNTLKVFAIAENNLHWTDIVYEIELVILQALVLLPIAVIFLIYEMAQILIDVVVCLGPFVLIGYLFLATRAIADRFVGKLIGLSLLMLLVDIVLSFIISGFNSFVAMTLADIASGSKPAQVGMCLQLVVFFFIGCLITTFLPGIASFIGGGISVSPLAMAAAARSVTSFIPRPSKT